MRSRGVPGVHLVVSASNDPAITFYRRTGFAEVTEDRATVPEESIVFGRRVDARVPREVMPPGRVSSRVLSGVARTSRA
ncbi:GNAT family N-acetyltransferase [Labedella populi]|uniref:GNAT family N-acetyltransferase n=1 Tax=Labedella populi TaxID=2498850 RepID=UPI003C7E4BD0